LKDKQNSVTINAQRDQAGNVKKYSPDYYEWQHLRRRHRQWHHRHTRFQWRVRLCMLDGVPGFMRGNSKRCDRRGVVNVAREAKSFLRRIVMIAQKIVRLNHLDVVNLRRL